MEPYFYAGFLRTFLFIKILFTLLFHCNLITDMRQPTVCLEYFRTNRIVLLSTLE